MKAITLRLALPAMLAIALCGAARADEAGRSDAPRGGLSAKIEFCKICHGMSGQGYYGFVPIPRLAGQQTEYFENQLRAFAERRRASQYMYGVSRGLSPGMRAALASHFRELHARPLGGGGRNLVAAGRRLYEDGSPETNVPACMACHGPDAHGEGTIPRLAGQLPEYIANKLVNWGRERGRDPENPDPSAVMLPTSHNLSRSQIAALAAYLSRQP